VGVPLALGIVLSPTGEVGPLREEGPAMHQDLQHLKLLSIFFYIVGGILALSACFLLIYLVIGVAFVAAPPPSSGGPPPAALGWIFILISCIGTLVFWVWAAALMVAGWYLGRCKHYTYCLVMGCLACLFHPFGTILGVFTIIVLIRPSVKRLFQTGGLIDEPPDRDEPVLASESHIHRNHHDIRNGWGR
jgi:hypothetical protein